MFYGVLAEVDRAVYTILFVTTGGQCHMYQAPNLNSSAGVMSFIVDRAARQHSDRTCMPPISSDKRRHAITQPLVTQTL